MVLHLRVQANFRGRCSIHEEQNRGDEGGRMRIDSHGANLVASEAKQGMARNRMSTRTSHPVLSDTKSSSTKERNVDNLLLGDHTISERVGIILVDHGCTAIHCTNLFERELGTDVSEVVRVRRPIEARYQPCRFSSSASATRAGTLLTGAARKA